MPFSDPRTPPPPWAVGEPGAGSDSDAGARSADESPEPLAQVFSFDTRQRVDPDRRPRGSGARVVDPTRPRPERRGRGGGPVRHPPEPRERGVEPDPHEWARQIVLRLLTGSAKSRSQLEQALSRRNCDPDVAREVLDRMQEVGLVDDTAYAQTQVRTQQANRGLAGRALAAHLRSKGVNDETVQSVLDDLDPSREEEMARELVAKKLRAMHGLEPQVQTRRLAGMLARKGYPADLTMRVIREALAEAEEHQRD